MHPNDESGEMSSDEIVKFSMEEINAIIGVLPLKDYHIYNCSDGTKRHIMEFEGGGRFEVMCDSEGTPYDYNESGVRFEALGDRITVRAAKAN